MSPAERLAVAKRTSVVVLTLLIWYVATHGEIHMATDGGKGILGPGIRALKWAAFVAVAVVAGRWAVTGRVW